MRKHFLSAAVTTVLLLVCALPADAQQVVPIEKIGTGKAITCGTTATLMDDPSVPDTEHRWVEIYNPLNNADIFWASSNTVTVADGMPQRGGSSPWVARVAGGTKLYCISSTPTTIRYRESK